MRWIWGMVLMVILGVPDARLGPDAWVAGPSGGASTITEADLGWETTPAAGNLKDPSGVPYAEPVVTGDVSAATSYTVETAIPGHVDRTGRYTATIGGVVYGANEPYVFGGVRTIAAVTSGAGYQEIRTVATRVDGRRHHVFADYAATPGRIRYSCRAPGAELDTGAVTVMTASVTYGTSDLFPNPEIEVVWTGAAVGYSLFVFAWDDDGDGTQTLRVARSDDRGATWSTYWTNLSLSYSSILTTEALRVRFEPLSRTWRAAVVRNATGTSLRTWVSRDAGGAEWSEIDSAELDDVTDVDMVVSGGRFLMATITSADTNIRTYEAAGATPGWQLAHTETTAGADSGNGLAMVANPSGWFYRWFRSSADNDEILMQVSTDGGRAWGKPIGRYPYQIAGADIVLDDDADGSSTTLGNGIVLQGGAWVGEEAEVVGRLAASATAVDNSVVGALFGGYSSLTTDAAPSGVDAPYYPTVIPETKSPQYQAFTTSGSATQSVTTDADGALVYRISTASETGYDIYRPIGDPAVCGAVWGIGRNSTGGALGNPRFALQALSHNDGSTDSYACEVHIDTSAGQLRGYDVIAAAFVGAVASYDNTKGLEVMLACDGNAGRAALYIRAVGDTAWVEVFSNEALTAAGSSFTTELKVGSISGSSVAQIDTLYLIPFGSASDAYVAELAAGTSPLIPIRATAQPQLLPDGARSIRWTRSPLMAGDSWTVATLSATPWKLVSPRSVSPSPTRRWRGTVGSAGAAYRAAFEYPTGGGRLSHNMAFVSFHNFGPIGAMIVRRWDGAAYQTEFEATLTEEPFGASGATGWRRDTNTSLRFYPNAANGTARIRYAEDLLGRWALITDTSAVNQIAGRINHVDPGQFSTTSGALQGSFSIDPDSLAIVSGSLAGMGTSTSTGTIYLYPESGMILGKEKAHTDQYGAVEFSLAPGITRPTGGLLMLGAAYVLARPERDGASYRQLAPSELRAAPGGLLSASRPMMRVTRRVYDLPYDLVLAQPGRYDDGTAAPTGGFGSTDYYPLDNNLDVIAHAHEVAGQRMPVCLGIAEFTDDPLTDEVVIRPEQVMPAFLAADVDRTMTRGLLRQDGRHNKAGGRLYLEELT